MSVAGASPEAVDHAQLAAELRVAMTYFVRRFRAEAELPIPQLQALGLIDRLGPKTTSQLAAHEGMRPQSMAQTIAQLEESGLVERSADPTDGRQQLIAITPLGSASIARYRGTAEAWLANAMQKRLSAAEQADLARGVELLGRLTRD